MEINFLQAALIGILYYMTLCSPPWLTGIVHVSIRQPLVSGTIVGLILGDRSTRPDTNSTRFVLSETLTNARFIMLPRFLSFYKHTLQPLETYHTPSHVHAPPVYPKTMTGLCLFFPDG